MGNELWDTLLKFHREVAMPSILAEIADPIRGEIAALDRKMGARFDGVYQRLDRLESEYHALAASVKRLEDRVAAIEMRMTALEQKIAAMPLRSELAELKTRIEALERRPDMQLELAELRWRVTTLENKIAAL